jgi:prepilin-type N-terminal cleavage/methylation domain-containing protein
MKKNGFTLIELMIAMVIIGVLIMFAAPLTTNFLNTSFVSQTKQSVIEGYSIAKSYAIRNQISGDENTAMAYLVLTPTKICVQKAITAVSVLKNCVSSSDNLVWQATLKSSLTLGNSNTQCIALDNYGIPLSGKFIEDQSCNSSLNYSVSKGDINVSGILY